jgi:DNA gyrase subunit A
MSVRPDDVVIAAELTDGNGEILIATRDGMAIRFPEAHARAMGRTAQGVRGVSLRAGDEVVSMAVVKPGGTVLTVTERGYGKRTELDEYRVQSRGGVGIINIYTSDRNGRVAGVVYVERADELMLITQQGKILRMVASDIRPIGRATQGVRLIEIDERDHVVSLARLAEKDLMDKSTEDDAAADETSGDAKSEDTNEGKDETS